jgi:hypothetical protein
LAGVLALACLAILGLDTLIAVKLSINKSVTSFSSLSEATIILSSAGAGGSFIYSAFVLKLGRLKYFQLTFSLAGILVWYLRKEGQTLER